MDDEISGFFGVLGAPEAFVGLKGKWRSGGDEGGFEGINGKRHWGVQAKMEDSIPHKLIGRFGRFFFFFLTIFSNKLQFSKRKFWSKDS